MESLTDHELLALRDEIGLMDARLEDLIKRVDTGESGFAWINARKALDKFLQALSDGDSYASELAGLQSAIKAGLDDYQAWNEIALLIEQRRKLVESERKRLVEMQQVITVERAMLLISAITDVIKRNVADREQLSAINLELRALLSKTSAKVEGPALSE